MKTWTVDPEGDYDADVQQYRAKTPEEAAARWALERGHDVDDCPFVKVSAKGEPDRFFSLSAKVSWSATPAKPRVAP